MGAVQNMCECSNAVRLSSGATDGVIRTTVSDQKALSSFKMFLSAKWKSRAEAFGVLADFGSCIDKTEFHELFDEYTEGNIDHVFDLLDAKREGTIRRAELRTFVRGAVAETERGAAAPQGARRLSRKKSASMSKSEQEDDSPLGAEQASPKVPRRSRTDGGMDTSAKKAKNGLLRRSMTEGDSTADASLLDFQTYFYRRPLRVQKAFAEVKVKSSKEVDLQQFSKLMAENLQYSENPEDASRIFAELKELVGASVTWGGVKQLLERPWPVGD